MSIWQVPDLKTNTTWPETSLGLLLYRLQQQHDQTNAFILSLLFMIAFMAQMHSYMYSYSCSLQVTPQKVALGSGLVVSGLFDFTTSLSCVLSSSHATCIRDGRDC